MEFYKNTLFYILGMRCILKYDKIRLEMQLVTKTYKQLGHAYHHFGFS